MDYELTGTEITQLSHRPSKAKQIIEAVLGAALIILATYGLILLATADFATKH